MGVDATAGVFLCCLYVVVTREKLRVDDAVSCGQTQRIDLGRLLMRYNDLKASPPPHIVDELLLISNFSMSVAHFSRNTTIADRCILYC